MKYLSIIIMVAALCSSSASYTQYANLQFVENKGQWNDQVKFRGEMNNGAFYLKEKGFSVNLNNTDDLQQLADFYHGIPPQNEMQEKSVLTPTKVRDGVTVRSHAYNVTFLNAQTPAINPDKPLENYNNYIIGNDPSKWQGNCKIFQAVSYKNLYPGVDIRYYTNEGSLKYDIIVQPGADLSKVVMSYEGVDGLEIKDRQLVVKTSVGDVHELSPYAYQVYDGLKKEVNCNFRVLGNTVRFDVGSYTKSSVLVIDPTLIFSSFTGSTSDNWGYTATYGPDGSFYAGGIVFGAGFRTTTGAYQTTFGGGISDEEGLGAYDIGIMKFSPNGSRVVYATYIGGSGNEHPHSLVVDSKGELVIGGRTNSSNYPTIAQKFGPGGDYDIIITKLNAAGSGLVGSIKIGGTAKDGVNIRPKYAAPRGVESIRRNYGDDSRSEVILDSNGDILLASNTQSSDFRTLNPFQATIGGKQDGVIIKVSADVSNVLMASFLGGSENDAAFVLAINPLNGQIYVGGNTVSTNLPGNKTGVLYNTFQAGETDGFVAILSPDATALQKMSYMGTSGNDMLYGIQFDKFGFPYIMGTTSGNWPVQNAVFSQAGGKQYIAKLKPDLSDFVYSTVFGTRSTSPNISPIAFLVDRCENVYVSGWGGQINSGNSGVPGYPNSGTNGLTTTPDAIQSVTDNSDFYFFVLERDAVRQLYGSFFGQQGGSGEHVDGGTSRFDRNGVIYQALCANCGRGANFPTTPGVAYPQNGSTNCNLAAVKIAFNLAGVAGSIKSAIKGSISDTAGCVPLEVDFTDTIAGGQRYVWNFGDGSPEVTTIEPTVKHLFTKVGTYRVRLASIDSSKCNIVDTVYTNIKVRTFRANLDFTPRKVFPCDAFDYKFENDSYVSPAVIPFGSRSFTWNFGDNTPSVVAGTETVSHSFPGPGIYNVSLLLTDTSFCNAPTDTIKTLRIATNVKAAFTTPAVGCAPYDAYFNNTSAGGQSFIWNFGDGTSSTEVSPIHTYPQPGTYTIMLTAVDSATCNVSDSSKYVIQVKGKPIASFTYSPNPPQENTPVVFSNSSIGATRYLWNFDDGDSVLVTSTDPITHIFNETKTYNTCLVAFNDLGCPDTTCQPIVAKVYPLLDVPNAFTPNGDGINDKVFVRGYGIVKLLWRIYNRWGVLVFETTDRSQGWDGTYKGSMQPKEVYHYVLNVEFTDGNKYSKKGDITLLR